MHLLKAQAASSLWLLFLMQAHRALSCTFTSVTTEAVPWAKVQYNTTITAENLHLCPVQSSQRSAEW
uniref:Secreted protein n=1 Tax=Haemonchus contortus TaxID=6289 RepID=A0A7I4Y3Q8_HAECO